MDKNLYLKCDFEAVFLINGAFVEGTGKIAADDEEAYFVTVLPLSAALLPYTIKISAMKVRSNPDLARLYALPDGEALLRFLPRYAYVYSPAPRGSAETSALPVPSFFCAVKNGDFTKARRYLTAELSSAADDETLAAFFDGYDDIIIDPENAADIYYLAASDGNAAKFRFRLRSGLIDDVTECKWNY